MAQTGQSLYRRIRCIKSSLDKAEQSFMDNKDIRGELDLMLAEAELKNLRRKKDVPWSWNRQVLAGCTAVLLLLAGMGGWYVAKDHYKELSQKEITVPKAAVQAIAEPVAQRVVIAEKPEAALPVATVIKDTPIPKAGAEADMNRVAISQADMRRLVQSAKVELSNSN